MKALTVQQPWAWAMIYGGKDVENRTTLWKHRGPLAVHAGTRVSDRGIRTVPSIMAAEQLTTDSHCRRQMQDGATARGAIIGAVDVADVHVAHEGCCESWWAEQEYVEHGGRTRRQIVHLVLENPRPVDPIPCLGRLGLWTLPDEVEQQLTAALA